MGRGQTSTFSEYGHVAYQIKGNDACSNTVANSVHTLSIPEVGSKVKTLFSEGSRDTYQIKGNEAYSTMQAHIVSLHKPSAPRGGGGQKVKTCFSFPCTHPRPVVLGQKVKTFFLESGHVAYHIKGKDVYQHASKTL